MAYPTKGREPLLDSETQAALEKRTKELVGIGLAAVGVLWAMMAGSYTPDDPNWLVATDAPVQNWLGRFGASLAHPLHMIGGRTMWAVALLFVVWGVRLATHRGADRLASRIVFGPIWLAVVAVYLATLMRPEGWAHVYGAGGHLGDTVLAMVLTVMPFGEVVSVKLMAAVSGATMVLLGGYVLGATGPEMRSAGRAFLVGLVQAYEMALALLGRTAQGSARLAQGSARFAQGMNARVQDQMADRRARSAADRAAMAEGRATVPDPYGEYDDADPHGNTRHAAEARRVAAVVRANPARPVDGPAIRRMPHAAPMPMDEATGLLGEEGFGDDDWQSSATTSRAEPPVHRMPTTPPVGAPPSFAAPVRTAAPEPRGILARTSKLLRRGEPSPARMPEPELAPRAAPQGDTAAPDEARIRSRISDVIKSRAEAAAPRAEPPVTRPKRPRPLLLNTARAAATTPMVGIAETMAAASPAMPWMSATPQPVPSPTDVVASAPAPAPSAPDAGRVLTRETVRELTGDDADTADAYKRAARDARQDDDYEDGFDEDHDGDLDDDAVVEGTHSLRGYTASAGAAAPRPTLPATDPRKSVVQHPPKKTVQPSARAKAEAQPALPLEDKYANYEFPPLSLLTPPGAVERHHLSDQALAENARMLESVLDDYGVKGEIVSVRPGPVVTMYELEPAPGLKASRVIGLADDIARSMSALSARVSTVPGRSVIGIELPNEKREMVVLREMIAARDFGDSQMRLPLALGKDIGGEPIIANLAKMPHLLIAGTTGSGKSVAINTMILSLLYKLTPEECRLIMIDPKMLELSVYDGIPHLLSPVVTDPKKAVVALKWVVGEMEERYRKMSKMGVRNIDGYNGRVRDALEKGEMFSRTVQTGFDDETGDPIFETDEFQPEKLPYIVVIVDEMADLMMVAGKEIEACIQRLAQMARASGIHLIMATQRPSVDVITGTIKANFPTRISFQVTSKIDSRTILGEMGAEQLLGMGDMLYMAGGGKISRIHGPFCSDEEVEEIVNHLKGFGPPEYMSGVVEGPEEGSEGAIDAVLGLAPSADGDDALYDMAVQIAAKDRKCSTSYIQRKLAIGYNKAARLVEQMEDNGVVTAANHVGKREVLVPEPHYN